MHCANCGSSHIISKGVAPILNDPTRRRYVCRSCSTNFYVSSQTIITQEIQQPELPYYLLDEEEPNLEIEETEYPDEDSIDHEDFPESFIRSNEYIESIKSKKRIVVTTAQNNSEVDQDFLDTLINYCSIKDAALVIIPIRYKKNSDDVFSYQKSVVPYLVDNKIVFENNKLCICADLKLLSTAVNPLSGLDAFSKGNSLIIGHAQVQLRTLPRGIDRKYPPIITTTGAVTKKNYSNTKAGLQAEFNHSMSAVLVELCDDSEVFIRHLNYDEVNKGFYDLNNWYNKTDSIKIKQVDALITGDSHVGEHDISVYETTFGENGIVSTLNPKYLVTHDSLNFMSRSHHTIKNQYDEFAKRKIKLNLVEDELNQTCQYLIDVTPDNCKNIIVCSNHDMHIDRWLNEADIRNDLDNARIFHYLSYLKFTSIAESEDESKNHQAYEIYFRDYIKKKNLSSINDKFIFLSETDSFKLHGIELAQHSANGVNGSRGSVKQFANVPDKMIVGHSHSPNLNKGCYQVGTSTVFNLPYVKGFSSWDHAHCIIHPNGKRQMIFIRNGKYKL